QGPGVKRECYGAVYLVALRIVDLDQQPLIPDPWSLTPMKISAIRAYQIDLPLHEGSYKWSGGNSVSVFDSTVVAVDTDEGLTGWGEVCPLGPAYLPAYAAGARIGITELAPQLLGADPLALG